MTLTRLVLAWLPVALWFAIATAGTALVVGLPSPPAGDAASWAGVPLPLLRWRIVEAGLLTLLGSLWFDSLGTGAWWLVFFLIGTIAATPSWLGVPATGARPQHRWLIGTSADVARYVLAGGILAWRLG